MFVLFRIIEHPDYLVNDLNIPSFDFSLLKLSNGFNLPAMPHASPACLPTANVPVVTNVCHK